MAGFVRERICKIKQQIQYEDITVENMRDVYFISVLVGQDFEFNLLYRVIHHGRITVLTILA